MMAIHLPFCTGVKSWVQSLRSQQNRLCLPSQSQHFMAALMCHQATLFFANILADGLAILHFAVFAGE
jgi:hypothetical protein